MNKQAYLEEAFEIIRNKNIEVPFELVVGSVVTDLEKYLNSLAKAYLESKDRRLEQLFFEKIEFLKKMN